MRKYLYALMSLVAITVALPAYARTEVPIVVFTDEVVLNEDLAKEHTFLHRFSRAFDSELPSTVSSSYIPVQAKGLTANSVLQIMPDILEYRPHVAVVALGYTEARQGVDNLLIYNGIEQLVETLKQNRMYVILVGARAPDTADFSYQAQFNSMYSEIAKRQNVYFYPDIFADIRQHRDTFVPGTEEPTKYGIAMAMQRMDPHIKAIANQLAKRYAFD